MSGEPGPLIGRAAELKTAERVFDAAGKAPAEVLLVVGEPGTGKTRLLAELAERAERRGFRVHSARGGELERSFPFGIVVDALDQRLADLEPDAAAALDAEARSQLAAVFPAMTRLAQPDSRLAGERHRAHYAIRALLEQLARKRPLALVLDDVHWADDATVELLGHLVRRRPAAPAVIVLAYRSAQEPERLRAALNEAERHAPVDRVDVAPLTADEANQLLGVGLDAPTRRAIYRESGGNPFYLEELARAVSRPGFVAEQPVGAAQDRFSEVPATVVAALAAELAALSATAKRAAQAAAVVGESFEPRLVAQVADLEEAVALAALDELVEADLIRSLEPPLFRFRHPILRRAVYDSASAPWLTGAHQRAAGALAEAGASAIQRAHHEVRSAQAGDERAIALLTEAANASLALAPATAVSFFEAALRLLPDDAPTEQRLALRLPLAWALTFAGRFEASRETLRDTLFLLPADDPAHVRMVTMLAAVEQILGHYDEANVLLCATLERLPTGASTDKAALHLELAAARYFEGDWARMGEHAAEGRRIAERCEEPAQVVEAGSMLVLPAFAAGDVRTGAGELDAAASLFDELEAERLWEHLDAGLWLGIGELHLERYASAVTHLERGLHLAREAGQDFILLQFHAVLASTLVQAGKLKRARTHALESVEIARFSRVPNLIAWAHAAYAWSALRLGDLSEAIASGEEVERLMTEVASTPMTAGILALAEARVEDGSPERGRETLLRAFAGPDLPRLAPAFKPWAYEVLAQADLALDEVDGAAVWAKRVADLAPKMGLGRELASAATARAAVSLARGEVGQAVDAAREAVHTADEASVPIQAARARILAGDALARSNQPDAAIEILEEAHRELRRCGARRYGDEAERLLRTLGRRVSRGGGPARETEGIAGLSGREREVADLVTEGLTNREIAARMFLSVKTVERHLSKVFAKLGVRSRVQVARALERERVG